MGRNLGQVVENLQAAVGGPDAQDQAEQIVSGAVADQHVAEEILEEQEGATSLEEMAVHRSEELTVLAAVLPPGFSAAPHNHNIWSVVGVVRGREDNEFFERDGDELRSVGEKQVVAPGVLANPVDVIHSIANTLEEPLLALHAYGGDLLATPRSNWNPDTHEEIPFDWEQVSSDSND